MVYVNYILSIFASASTVLAAPHPIFSSALNARAANVSAANIPAANTGNATAIYFMTNDPAGNSIIALKINADGTLRDGSITPTGGKGMSGIDGSINATAAPDALFSQSALKVEGNTMVAVNPGSNTLTMMAISANDPCKLTMVGNPVSTMGEFPVTAAISRKNQMACVANSGVKAGLACFALDAKKGLQPIMQQPIPIDLKQTTPPAGPTNTVSQVLFNQDETMLMTTVKGDPTKNNTGFLSTLPINNGCPAAQDTRSSPLGTAVLFGTTLVPGTSNILATDASFGAATISTAGGAPKVLSKATVGNQKATCWAAISPQTKTAFVTDVGVNHIVEVDPANGNILQSTNLPNANPGMIDLVAAGMMVYALSPGDGKTTRCSVAALDVSFRPAKQVQNFEPKGAGKSSQGLTALF